MFFSTQVLIHIAGTVLIVGLFGPRIERWAGSAHLLGIYPATGLAGIGDWVSSTAHVAGIIVGFGYDYLLRSRTPAELPDVTTSNN